jgi:hypothetical protein
VAPDRVLPVRLLTIDRLVQQQECRSRTPKPRLVFDQQVAVEHPSASLTHVLLARSDLLRGLGEALLEEGGPTGSHEFLVSFVGQSQDDSLLGIHAGNGSQQGG